MARTFIFIVMALALTVGLYVSGITADNPNFSSTIMNQILNTNDASTTDLWTKILIAIGVITAGAVLASVFGNAGSAIAAANAGFVTLFLINFVSDYVYVLGKAHENCGTVGVCGDWVYWVISIIFVPIIGGMLLTLYQFVTGND